MSKINKILSVNNSYYAQQSRARHKHQEKKLDKILFNKNNKNLPMSKKATYTTFIYDAINGFTKILKKFFKLI